MKLRNLTTLSIGVLAAITLAACGDNEVETIEPMPAPAMPADGMTPPPVNDPAAMDPADTSPAT